MTESECLAKMIPPGMPRHSVHAHRYGIIQVQITRACNLSCFHCTQGSNLAGKPVLMSVEDFEKACLSLKGYFGVIGVFGGNPAMHPDFDKICEVFRKLVPYEQRGLWCNHPLGKGKIMRETFNPHHSNLNVHLDQEAWDEFERDWPETRELPQLFGLHQDSRHSPCFVAMKDLEVLPAHPGQDKIWVTKMPNTEENRHKLISKCDINQNWSALVGVVPGKGLRAFFCEVAYTQAVLHEKDDGYPDTGIVPFPGWWRLPMQAFAGQVRKHCHECGVPLRGHGEMAQAYDGTQNLGILPSQSDGEWPREQVSQTHADYYKPKRKGRRVELVVLPEQLGMPLRDMTKYIANAIQEPK